MNGSFVVGKEPYFDRGSRALVDPFPSLAIFRSSVLCKLPSAEWKDRESVTGATVEVICSLGGTNRSCDTQVFFHKLPASG